MNKARLKRCTVEYKRNRRFNRWAIPIQHLDFTRLFSRGFKYVSSPNNLSKYYMNYENETV